MEEIDLKELFNIFWNKKIQIIITVIVFMIIGAIYTMGFTTPMYSSSTTLVLAMANTSDDKDKDKDNNTITTTDVTLNAKLVSTYSELVKSKNILREVISNLNIDEDVASLRKNISVTAVEDTEVIKITVKHENAGYAAKIANEIANVFSKKINEIYKINNIYLVDEAEVADSPSNINHIKDIILFAFVGLALSVAYVFILNMLDTTIKTSEDIERAYGIPVLVTIPQIDNFDEGRGGRK